jgi:LAO/AO transport system kinase
MGDDIQAIKAGIMEITDIFIVNKMDLPGADRKVSEIMQMLELSMNFKYDFNNPNQDHVKVPKWTPKIVKVNSKTGENFKKLLEIINEHKTFLKKTGVIENYYLNRIRNETLQILKHKLTKKVERLIHSNSQIDEYLRLCLDKSLDPYSMANLIIQLLGIE